MPARGTHARLPQARRLTPQCMAALQVEQGRKGMEEAALAAAHEAEERTLLQYQQASCRASCVRAWGLAAPCGQFGVGVSGVLRQVQH